MKKRVFAAGVLLLPMAAFAGWGPQPVTITGYYVWDEGVAYIKTTSNLDPGSCGSSQYLALDTARTNFKAIWAQVIAAHASGDTVSLFYDGCLGGYPKIKALAVPTVW